MIINENRPLSELTTVRLGGNAEFFSSCSSVQDIIDSLNFAEEKNIDVFVLGGGSNVVFSDSGFKGLVIAVRNKGIEIHNKFNNKVIINAAAGEDWDGFVSFCIRNGYAGVECLSGIPGTVGAVPVQNVGAYGQEVKDVILSVKVLERKSRKIMMFQNEDCLFSYRTSRFKTIDADKYIILSVMFSLNTDSVSPPIYKELKEKISEIENFDTFDIRKKLEIIRDNVLSIRRKKSMVIDDSDSDSVSCGSFFMNPVLGKAEFNKFISLCSEKNIDPVYYETETGYKIPAAFLIEKAGFSKGYTENGAGISNSHSLALVNRGCSSESFLNFAEKISIQVFKTFGIKLHPEPVIVK